MTSRRLCVWCGCGRPVGAESGLGVGPERKGRALGDRVRNRELHHAFEERVDRAVGGRRADGGGVVGGRAVRRVGSAGPAGAGGVERGGFVPVFERDGWPGCAADAAAPWRGDRRLDAGGLDVRVGVGGERGGPWGGRGADEAWGGEPGDGDVRAVRGGPGVAGAGHGAVGDRPELQPHAEDDDAVAPGFERPAGVQLVPDQPAGAGVVRRPGQRGERRDLHRVRGGAVHRVPAGRRDER